MKPASYLKNRSQFNTIVLRAIDEGTEILGEEPVKRAFYFHLEKITRTRREDIPNNLDAFHDALVELFGQGGSILEKRIAKILFEKLSLNFETHDGWSLADYVKHAEIDPFRS